MGTLLRNIARLVAIVGLAALARPRQAEEPTPEIGTAPPVDVTLTAQERVVASTLPTPAQATEARARASHAVPPPGWSKPKPESTPEPTYWPVVLALGTTVFAWGLISNLFVFFAGILIFVVAAAGWIGDLLHEFA